MSITLFGMPFNIFKIFSNIFDSVKIEFNECNI